MQRITARLGLTLRLFYDQFALICTDNLKNALGDESVAERVLFFQGKKQCKSDICGNYDNSCPPNIIKCLLISILSYPTQFFNASCLRYFKIISRWFALREL